MWGPGIVLRVGRRPDAGDAVRVGGAPTEAERIHVLFSIVSLESVIKLHLTNRACRIGGNS